MEISTFGLPMEKVSSLTQVKNAKLYVMYSLAFLVLLFFSRCHRPPKQPELIWENEKAIGISIPKNRGYSYHSVKITRSSISNQQILGSFTDNGDEIEFKSIIPLTSGLSYDVWNGQLQIARLDVPYPNGQLAPVLTAIYPETDTVPENLLKFYFRFSKPMRTGASLEHIYLLDKKNDTLRNVFLNLQPELWDTSGKILTVWIDPGRIKRDLVLNKKLGNPLKQNAYYKLVISTNWKDTQGFPLADTYSKSFVVVAADHEVPDIQKWTLSLPKSGTKHTLIIDAKESLDHLLFAESLSVLDSENESVEGRIMIEKDQIWKFTPLKPWGASKYHLQVNARLEDLAANNLNRVFDRDTRAQKSRNEEVVKREFILKP
ncbi:MAG: hypothetical protein KAY27_01465 [Pedobacter sp.]|nr:hypothetical protein [Pedobacter sp.]